MSLTLVLFSRCLAAVAPADTAAAGPPPAGALPDAPQPAGGEDSPTIRGFPGAVLADQKAIWTSPFRFHAANLKWEVPLLLATGAAIATDHRAMRDVVSLDHSFNNNNATASNILISPYIAAPVVLYGIGHFRGNEHARETGLLGAEALVDGLVVEQGMKLIFWRERPYQDMERGRFFTSSAGIDSSFPSSHNVLAWSEAAVIASEYHNPATRILVYTGAVGISFTRLMGQQHFPSDILVGAASGWLIGHYVYKHRHRHELAQR